MDDRAHFAPTEAGPHLGPRQRPLNLGRPFKAGDKGIAQSPVA